jgi:glycosyltransferase involved in cell wall biosynthesis
MRRISSCTVALVSNTSWSIYNFRAGLIQQLLLENIKVVIIAPQDAYSAKLQEWGCVFEPVNLNKYGTNPVHDLRFCWQIGKILRKHAINFLITYTIKPNIYANLVARWYRIPSIALVTGLGHLFTIRSWKTTIATWLYWLALRTVAQVWFLNREDMQYFTQKRIVKNRQARYLPSEGVDTEQFSRSNPKAIKPSKDKSFTFLFAGRLLDEKGVREYVAAARRVKTTHPYVKFEILGFIEDDFPYAVTAKELAIWHKEGVIAYLGTTDNIEAHLERVDCVVLPSYYREGVPRILLEAASMQLPIITTDNVGCKDIVKHGYNGFLCRKKDEQDLAYWINQMLTLTAIERHKMGMNGRIITHRLFREDLIINRYLAILQQYHALKTKVAVEEPVFRYQELENVIPLYYQM